MADSIDDFLAGKPQAPAADTGGEIDEFLGVAQPGFVPTVKRTGGQMLTTGARALEDVTGPNAVTRGVRALGQGIIDRNPGGINSLGEIVESPVLAVKEAVGQFVPQIGAAMVGAKAGAMAGQRAAGPRGAAVGGVVGGLAPIFTQEYGGIRDEQIEGGQEDKGRALAAAAGATALERIAMPIKLTGGLRLPAAGGSIPGAIAKGAVKEGVTEAAQTAIEQVGAFKDPLAPESTAEQALAGAMGGIGGGVVGGASAGVQRALGPNVEPAGEPSVLPESGTSGAGGDPLRAQKPPVTGPLTLGVNALIEGEAQAADGGAPVQAPVSGALAGITPPSGDASKQAGGDQEARPIPAGEATELPADDEGAAVFDPATGTIAPPPRASFTSREEVQQHLSKQRRSGGTSQGKAMPYKGRDGAWTFVREGEPDFEQAQQDEARIEADVRMKADRAFDAALPTMPQHLRDLKPGDRKLFGLDSAIEASRKPLATNEPIDEEPNRTGVAYTPEIATMQAHKSAQAVKTQDGMLRSGNRTGATTGGLVQSWVAQQQAKQAIERSRKERPDLWNAYDERQKAMADVKVGDTVLTPYPSIENPLGTPGKVVRKFGTNWRIEQADGSVVMVPPTALRPPVASAPTAAAQSPVVASTSKEGTPGSPADVAAPNSRRQESGAQTDPNATGNGNMARDTADAAPGGGQAEGEGAPAPSPGSTQAPPADSDTTAPTAGDIDAAANAAATSPTNDLPEPTDAQKEAGNYTKGHTRIDGMGVTIENPKGSTRRSKADDPNQWEVTMPAHYGYIKRTVGADTVDPKKPEQVDITIGDKGANGRYWVINQKKPGGGFDEHKVFTGVDSADEAVTLYKASFADNFGDKVFESISAEYDAEAMKALLPSLKKARPVKAASAEVEKPEVAAPAPAPAPPAEDSAEARWTRTTTADRLAVLARAGWSVNPPSLSTRRTSVQPWAKLTDSQRARIAAAMGAPPPADSRAAMAAEEEAAGGDPVVWAGRAARNAGRPRKAPPELSAQNAPRWLKGWDEAGTQAPAIDAGASRQMLAVNDTVFAKDGRGKGLLTRFLDATNAMVWWDGASGPTAYPRSQLTKDAPAAARWESYKIIPAPREGRFLVTEPRADGSAQNLAEFGVNATTLKPFGLQHFFESPQTREPVAEAVRRWADEQARERNAKTNPMTGAKKPVTPQVPSTITSPLGAKPAAQDEKKDTIVGRRADGVMIRADERGVRFYAADGVRVFETVTMRPTRDGVKVERGPLKPEFMTAEESAAVAQDAPAADTPKQEPTDGSPARQLDRTSERPLEGAPSGQVRGAARSRDAGAGAAGSSGGDIDGDAGAAGPRDRRASGLGDGEGAAPVPARGAGREPGRAGDTGVPGAPRPDARAGSGTDAGRAGLEAPNAAAPVPPQFDPLDFTSRPQDAVAPRAPELDLPPVTDFQIDDDLALGEGGQKAKFRGNVEAIRLLRDIEAAGRLATATEQRTLARYVGWGQLSQAFDEANKDWSREHAELKALLSPEEYEAAKESTQYAHYTSREIINGIYAAVQRMGFTGGRMLEPGVGVGNFIGLMPASLRTASRFTGIERELISSGIARQLYPAQNIQRADFTEFIGNDGYFDLVIGNPPFARTALTDSSGRKHLSGLSVHNYFFAKAVDLMREGGILAQVVSNSFLDAKRDNARRYIADRVEFLGAIRLPNNAFAKNAGTEVTTDLVFLKKLPESQWASRANKDNRDLWLDVESVPDPAGGEAIPLNRYFVQNPDMLLGQMGRFGTMYGPGQPALVARPGQDTAALLDAAIQRLPADVYQAREPSAEQVNERGAVALRDATVQEGGHYLDEDGKLYQRLQDEAGEGRAVEITPETPWTEKTKLGQAGFDRIKALAQLRVTLRRLLAAELANDPSMERLRKRLNGQYDAYVKDFGLINDRATARVFDDDPDYPLLASLEHNFTPGITLAAARKLGVPMMKATAKKAPIFTSKVVSTRTTPTRADSPADALNISLAERGRIDAAYIGSLLGKDGEEALKEMAQGERPLLFLDPATQEYVLRDAYLSGNVRAKLAQARAAGMFTNARALEAAQPPDVGAHEISVRLGSPWVPTAIYEDFAKNLFGDGTKASIYYTKANSSFSGGFKGASEVSLRNTWGTPAVGGDELLVAILNNRDIKVTYLDAEKKLRTDVEKTEAANLKASEIRQAFLDWAFRDADRSELLTKTYNETNNNYVTRAFDGSYMQFPGKVPDSAIKFRRHQRNAIARIVQDRTTLLDHVVGAGKTYTIVSAAMEMKRTGLATKPLVVVPNHLVKQWAADFYRLYPAARVLTATKKDFQKDNRRKFLAKIATGDWDAVVMAHSSFGFIRPAPEFEARFNEQQVRSIVETIKAVEDQDLDASAKKRTVKQLAALKERLENRIKALREKPIDALLDFEQIGVDQLFVDEAHLFKNLMFTTKMQNVRGLGDPTGSQRAYDLFVKAHQLFEKNGRGQGLVFATGTPVSNSLAEMYHMMRYLMPAQMEAAGFVSFDAWANTFASVEQTWMQKFSGDGFKADNRMSTFVNTPELLKMFDQVADTVTMEDIKAAFREENEGREFPLPKLKTGRRQPVSLTKSEAQNAYMADIAARAKAIEGKRTNQKGMDNALTIMGDARKAAMDIRLVDVDITEREKGGRVDRAADEILTRYRQYDNVRGTQLVFSDLGTPIKHARAEMKEWEALQARIQKGADSETQVSANLGNEAAMALVDDADAAQAELDAKGRDWLDAVKAALRGFSVYDDLKAALIERGMHENQIAFIHDYNTDDQKASLFRKVNAGDIRVLMGSTPKLGAGTNVQERLVALHHLDVPWKPSDVEQREGRIIRQGNVLQEQLPDFEVEILGYVTQDTLDMRMWQIQETKLKMINQLRSRKIGREIDNAFEDMEMSAGEMQAAATGNMDLLKEIQLRSDVRKLEQQQRSHDAQRGDLETRRKRAAEALRVLPAKLEAAKQLSAASDAYRALQEARRAQFKATIDGKEFTDAREAGNALQRLVDAKVYVRAAISERKDNPPISPEQYAALSSEEQKKWDAKAAPIDVEFNGKRYTAREKLAEAFAESRGDVTPPMWSHKGQAYDRAANLEQALRADVASAALDEKLVQIGKLGDFEASVEGQGKDKLGNNAVEVVVSAAGQSLGSTIGVATDEDGLRRAARNVISTAMSMASGASSRATFLADDLARAQRAKEELSKVEAMGDWPGTAKLAAKRQEHREVLKRLSAASRPKAGEGGELVLSDTEYADRFKVPVRAELAGRFVVVTEGGVPYQDVPDNGFETREEAQQWLAAQTVMGAADDDEVQFSQALPDPPFYSELARHAERASMNAAPASGWLSWLKGLPSKGVKPDEIEWSGLPEWLSMQQGKVPKQAIVAFLNANGVRVTETVLGEPRDIEADLNEKLAGTGFTADYDPNVEEMSISDADGEFVDFDDLPANVRRIVNESMKTRGGEPTKYGQYTLPGGTNYREVLLTLPAGSKMQGVLERAADGEMMIRWADGTGEYLGTKNRVDAQRMLDAKTPDTAYKSGHWDQPNVLAHIRLNDRTDADGKRVLFVEEIQSDWAQQGKKHGLQNPAQHATADELREAAKRVKEADDAKDAADSLARMRTRGAVESSDKVRRLMADPRTSATDLEAAREFHSKEHAKAEAAINAQMVAGRALTQAMTDQNVLTKRGRGGLPAAPFVGKTDAWVALALKRIVKMAVDEGYDRVAFVTGEQSADRYDLSKQVDSITYFRNKDGSPYGPANTFNVHINVNGRERAMQHDGVTIERVEELVGKDLAQKIADNAGSDTNGQWYSRSAYEYAGYLKGGDLKVGGEGMRAFYDKIVPSTLKDVLRKVGGGVLTTAQIDVQGRAADGNGLRTKYRYEGPTYTSAEIVNSSMRAKIDNATLEQQARDVAMALRGGLPFAQAMEENASIALAEKIGGKMIEREQVLAQQTAFEITPAMREKAAGGLPLFAQGRAADAPSTVASVQREIAALFPGDTGSAITIVQTVDALPSSIRAGFKKAGAHAVTVNKRHVYLVADRIERGTARALVMHELGVHVGLTPDDVARFTRQIERWAQGTGQLADMAKLALRAGQQSSSTNVKDEPVAYMVQFMVDAGWTPQRAPLAARGLLRRFADAIKAALRALGLTASDITPQDMVNYVYGAAKMALNKAPTPSAASQFANASQFAQPLDALREVRLPSQYLLGDLMDKAGTISWWHKTVGTMHDLAKRSAPFRRVYDGAQRFINDISYYATEAADLAPRLLPKLETWRDIGKSPISAADSAAIRAPIFEGTLTWARDERGNAVRVDELERRAGTMTPEGKARELFKRGLITEQVLKMWQGLPVEQYEASVSTRYANLVLKPGVVFTEAELRQHFKLTAGQAKLYREFRDATDRSLTNMAISDMLRYGGEDVAALREQALAAGSAENAATLLRDHLFKMAEANDDRAAVLNDTANTIVAKGERAADLIKRGYAPLMRFGQYTLDVVDQDGERVYFGLFETARDRARMERQMRANYPRASIAAGTTSQEDYKMFAGISPETVELFGELLGLEADGGGAANEAFQTYLKRAKATRSAMKRLIERKGIDGFSEDAGRVLAGFVVSNARQTSGALHLGEMTDAVEAIPQGQGQLKDAAVQLYQYVRNPQEEAQNIRGLLFAQYLGGSVASAMVNALQPLQVTFPYLSQYAGIAGAANHMRRAVADALKRQTGDKALDAALHVAAEKGIVSPQEVHQLIGQAAGNATLRSGDGTRVGDAAAKASNGLSRLRLAWGKVFGVAEQFNRRSTFIAAYRIAVEKGMTDPAAFAEQAVVDTQFNYTKANRPRWARGAVGSVLFTFKTYSINYVELLHRMATRGGPEGRRAALLALGVLFVMSGAAGLPGSDDLDDIIDGLLQRLGYNFQSKAWRQQVFAETLGLGELGARIIEHGVSAIPGVPIDVSGRLGLGNLIPGTRLFTTQQDYGRAVTEVAGPIGDLAQRFFDAGGKAITGDVKGAIAKAAPLAAQNLIRGIDMGMTGRYKDERGKKVIDTDGYDAAVKAIGFQPADVARVQRAARTTATMVSLNKMREAEISDAWAKGVAEKDADAIAAARADLAAWNRDNPESPIRITMQQIRQRVVALNQSRAERLARTAPREIRSEVRRQLDAGAAP